jgi:hypothetical protein
LRNDDRQNVVRRDAPARQRSARVEGRSLRTLRTEAVGQAREGGGMITDGGPAFPCPHPSAPELGMSLRDYFAAKAVQGMICNGFIPAQVIRNKSDFDYTRAAYALADAMLAERDKK